MKEKKQIFESLYSLTLQKGRYIISDYKAFNINQINLVACKKPREIKISRQGVINLGKSTHHLDGLRIIWDKKVPFQALEEIVKSLQP